MTPTCVSSAQVLSERKVRETVGPGGEGRRPGRDKVDGMENMCSGLMALSANLPVPQELTR